MKKQIRQFTLATFLATTSVAAFGLPLSFTVDAYLNSTTGGVGVDTGISLAAGEQFTVSVNPNDLWSAGGLPRWSNADGLVGNLYATGSDESGQPLGTLIGQSFGNYSQDGFSYYFGALVGKLSNEYFLLGANFSGPAPVDGTLNLYYWDMNYSDNWGGVVATVERQTRVTPEAVPVPEPGTLMLIGLGLTALALRRRTCAA